MQVNETDCYIEEGCLNGYGARELVRFTTHIKNIGDLDYYIGVNYSGVCTIVLPGSTDAGRVVIVKDESGAAGTGVNRNIRISGTTQIDGQDEAILSYDYGSLTFIYRDGWRIV
jgi:hypothetical protein